MKKRILALLLAGVLATSLVACVGGGENDPDDETVDTENESSTDDEYTPSEDDLEADDFWVEETETVYTHSTAYLREEPDGSSDSITTISAATKLTRTKVSTTWSYVEYANEEGETLEGYISNNYITETDITGSDFELVTGGSQVVYSITETLNVRKYPIAAEYSTVMGYYSMNDEIRVVATNGTWFKVSFETDEDTGETLYYYVNATFVSTEIGGDPVAENPYDAQFIEVNPPKIMYTNTAGLNLRSDPVISSSTVIMKFSSAGIKVSVKKEGNVTDEYGDVMRWSYVTAFLPPEKDGDPATTKEGYIASEYLTEKALPDIRNLSLAEILSLYPTFTSITPMNMYVVKNPDADTSVRLRATPELTTGAVDSQTSNVIGSISTKKDATVPTAFKVVATNNKDWYITERTNEKNVTSYAFITSDPRYVTSDPAGNVKITLENLTVAYPGYQLLDQPLTITATKTANGYYTPNVAKTVPYPMQAGAQASLVAMETGTDPVWYVIQHNGTLYFVPMSSFASIENG
ncbi:MAG: SH3 domain-containing protein [Ruminococcaceae bacterium]|nr:SH3 domain-containing protein [Oscillospiraceae bacterium]